MALPLWKDAEELERRLRAAEPAVRVVPERHVRRVLHLLNDAGDSRVLNPGLPVWVSAGLLVGTHAIPAEKLTGVGGDLLLLSAADDRGLSGVDDGEVLRHYWRLLFRARLQRDLSGRLGAAEVERRLGLLPPEFVEEVRFVLEADHVIRHRAPVGELYAALAATSAELLTFAPGQVHEVYPSAPPAPDLRTALDLEPGVAELAAELRPHGSAAGCPVENEGGPASPVPTPGGVDDPGESDRQARLGNYTRAAVKRFRASRTATAEDRQRLEQSAQGAIRNGLIKGLGRVLGHDEERSDAWFRAVWPLVAPAAVGVWPHAARALYDLQKLAAGLRGRLYGVAPVEWLTSLGSHPIRRSLDRARDVILYTGLSRCEKHVLRSHLSDADRDRLLGLLHEEMAAAEDRIRHEIGPVIRGVLDRVGMTPDNLPELVARDKVVAELVDRVCERGYLRIGDIRDAIARNQLKLPDLAGPGEFVRGDSLLRADKLLADELFGVYHRGEIYLRWVQRASALFFGTPVGRAITLYLALPFGGAFLGLMFAEELRHLGGQAAAFVSKVLAPKTTPTAKDHFVIDEETGEVFWFDPREATEIVTGAASSTGAAGHHTSWLIVWPTVLALGTFLLLLIHAPAFRRIMVDGSLRAWRVLRFVVWGLPVAVVNSPVIRAVWRNRVVRFVGRYCGVALLTTAALAVVMAALGASPARIVRWAAVVFTATTVVANTPAGRRFADGFAESASDAWRMLRVNLIPGLVGWFVWAFRELLGAIDRALYAVDEALRYREGASRPSVAVKVVLALAWFPVAYVVRFAFYLLIEPQVNPVKHFPVVTVSHKVIAPLFPTVADVLNVSEGTAILILAGVPGVFGFIAWELLANWRLYAANRPATLRPVPLGHHGETGRGLLRPGFHSGTVPKLYRKLRAGWLEGRSPPPDRKAKVRHDLHHIEVALRRLCERELFPLWASARPTAGLRPVVTGVHLGCQHVTLAIELESDETPPMIVMFRNEPSGMAGEVTHWGWASSLTADQQAVIRTGAEGLLALAAARPGGERSWDEWVEFWGKREAGG